MSITRIFQIGYDEASVCGRARLLRGQGYSVNSVVGNESAKAVLPSCPDPDVFLIGDQAPLRVQLEIVRWLRESYPGGPIVLLDQPGHAHLEETGCRVVSSDPRSWLPMIGSQLHALRPPRQRR